MPNRAGRHAGHNDAGLDWVSHNRARRHNSAGADIGQHRCRRRNPGVCTNRHSFHADILLPHRSSQIHSVPSRDNTDLITDHGAVTDRRQSQRAESTDVHALAELGFAVREHCSEADRRSAAAACEKCPIDIAANDGTHRARQQRNGLTRRAERPRPTDHERPDCVDEESRQGAQSADDGAEDPLRW